MPADDRPPRPEFPWATVIRREMETWRPERLPARFEPRPRRRAVDAVRPGCSLAAAGLGVLVLIGFAFGRL